jgi:ABC-2 type transport system ATP-binding protein
MDAAVELVDVVKRFGPKTAVDRLSLRIPRGSCYGLIGPNGAGKTTTFSLMCGFLAPTSGTLSVLGASPSASGALKGHVGVLPQDALLPPWERVGRLLTDWAALSWLPNPEQEARTALQRVGLAEAWDVKCNALSHGMTRRVAIAQAIMGAPPVILLDEPTGGLDPRVAAEARALIRSLKGEHTLVISSHNLQELEELCDAAAILDRGVLVREGTMAELTGQGEEFTLQLVPTAPIPEEALRAVAGCASVGRSADGRVQIRLQGGPGAPQPEQVITACLRTVIDAGGQVSEVHRGRKLEQRVLELT